MQINTTLVKAPSEEMLPQKVHEKIAELNQANQYVIAQHFIDGRFDPEGGQGQCVLVHFDDLPKIKDQERFEAERKLAMERKAKEDAAKEEAADAEEEPKKKKK